MVSFEQRNGRDEFRSETRLINTDTKTATNGLGRSFQWPWRKAAWKCRDHCWQRRTRDASDHSIAYHPHPSTTNTILLVEWLCSHEARHDGMTAHLH